MLLTALQAIATPVDIPASARSPQGARAALLYKAGDWEQAHAVAQNVESPEGSFWHGILHCRAGEWDNAKYWFRRVGRHAVFAAIQFDAVRILSEHKDARLRLSEEWDPFQFILWCEEAAQQPGSPEEQVVTEIQISEWRHLFYRCIE